MRPWAFGWGLSVAYSGFDEAGFFAAGSFRVNFRPAFHFVKLVRVAERRADGEPEAALALVHVKFLEREAVFIGRFREPFAVAVHDHRREVRLLRRNDERDRGVDRAGRPDLAPVAFFAVAGQREKQDLCPFEPQKFGGFREPIVPADHDPDFAEIGLENGQFVAGDHALHGFVRRKVDLAVHAGELPLAVDQKRCIVEDVFRRHFVHVGADPRLVLPRVTAQKLERRAPGQRLGLFGVRRLDVRVHETLGEEDQVRFAHISENILKRFLHRAAVSFERPRRVVPGVGGHDPDQPRSRGGDFGDSHAAEGRGGFSPLENQLQPQTVAAVRDAERLVEHAHVFPVGELDVIPLLGVSFFWLEPRREDHAVVPGAGVFKPIDHGFGGDPAPGLFLDGHKTDPRADGIFGRQFDFQARFALRKDGLCDDFRRNCFPLGRLRGIKEGRGQRKEQKGKKQSFHFGLIFCSVQGFPYTR